MNRVYRESAVCVKSSGKDIARFRRGYMAPGEMERVKLSRGLLERAEQSLELSVEEE